MLHRRIHGDDGGLPLVQRRGVAEEAANDRSAVTDPGSVLETFVECEPQLIAHGCDQRIFVVVCALQLDVKQAAE